MVVIFWGGGSHTQALPIINGPYNQSANRKKKLGPRRISTWDLWLMNQIPCHGAAVHLVRGHQGQLQRVITLIQKSEIIIFLCSSSSACPYKNLVSRARLSYPKRESLVKAVLGSCIARPYLATLRFDNQLCNCGPQFVYQTTLYVPRGHQLQSYAVSGHTYWSRSVGYFTLQTLCYHCQTINIPAVQLANTAFTRQSGVRD